MNAEEVKVYRCSECGLIYYTEEQASNCCHKPKKVCEDCAEQIDYKGFTPEFTKYAYGTKKCFIEVDIDNAIESALEDSDVDQAEFDEKAVKELRDFVAEWNKKNAIPYFIDTNIVIEIPEELRKKYTEN